jgi:hypothetical protein
MSRLVVVKTARVHSGCPWLFDSGGKPLSPLPRTLYIKEKTKFQAANHSVRRHGQTDKQIHKQTPPTKFFYNMWMLCNYFYIFE